MGKASIDPTRTIAEIVCDHEETRSVFLRHGVRPTQTAAQTLEALGKERRIDVPGLVRDLEHAIDESEPFEHGAFEWDVHAGVVRVSPSLASLLGLPELEGPPEMILARVHPDDRARVERLFARAAKHGGGFSFEYRVGRPGDAARIFASQVEPIESGSPTFVGMSWDISTQRHRPAEADASGPLLHSTLEATADGILVVDRSGNITTYNERFLSLWRIPNSLAIEGTDETLLHYVLDQLEDPVGFLAGVHALYATPEKESFDSVRFKDGRVYERYSRPQRVAFAIVGRVWSFREVTLRERPLAQKSFLADVPRLLGSLDIRPALDAVAAASVPRLGEACAIDVFGDGGPYRAEARAPEASRLPLPTVPKEVLAGQTVMTDVRAEVSMIVAPLAIRENAIGAITVVAPLTRRHTRADLDLVGQLASRLALAIENARLFHDVQEALHVRDEFLAIASHELRGPLASLHLAVETLARPDLPEATRDQMIALVAREDRRLGRLADDVMDITRIRAGTFGFADEDVDLVEVVRRVATRLATEIERSHSTLSIYASRPVIGRWDRARIDKVVAGLISNAIKFGLGKAIEVCVDARDGNAMLVVEDQGLGVPPARREAIFQPFERAVSAHHYGGLGLGLYIVHTIVTRYGGTVNAEERVGGGSRFVVRLPQLPEPPRKPT